MTDAKPGSLPGSADPGSELPAAPGESRSPAGPVEPARPAPPSGPIRGDDYETSGTRVALIIGGLLALGLFLSWPITIVILGIVVMLFIHEAGHFLTAKWTGMKATEFFIGFGPKIWSFTRGETEYGLKLLPAGAYVRIIGMNNLDEVEPADEPRAYRQQTFPRRLLVVLAGPATHFVIAWVLLFVLFVGYGLPTGLLDGKDQTESTRWDVYSVTEDSAAADAGLRPGDKVVAYDGREVDSFSELTDEILAGEVGDRVTLTVERGDRTFDTSTRLVPRPADAGGETGAPFLGVKPEIRSDAEPVGAIDAVGRATVGVGQVTKQSVIAVGSLFSPSGLSGFADTVREGGGDGGSTENTTSGGESQSEPDDGNRMLSIVGATMVGAQLAEEGLNGLLLFFLSINIFVGLLNLLPLLPFDGGHAAVAVYERIRSRPGRAYHADVTKLLPVAYAVVMGLVVLGVTTLYLDIVNPVSL